MNRTAHTLPVKTRKVIGLQVVIGVLAGGVFFVSSGAWGALSAVYGGLVSIVSTSLLSRGVVRAGERVRQGARQQGQAALYAGAAVRFVLVLLLFGVALAVLKLAPLPLVAGFVMTQLAFLLINIT